MSTWLQALLSGLLGVLIAALVSYVLTKQQVDVTIKYQQLGFARELTKEFYYENDIHKKIRMAIERCQPLYNKSGGSFSNDQINIYLGFFDDLGFYWKKDFLGLDVINHLFGGYIIEAFEYPEIRQYMARLQTSMEDPKAFSEFKELAERLEKDPNRQRQVQLAREVCKRKK